MCMLAVAGGVAALSAISKYQQNQSQASAYNAQAQAYSNQAHQQIQQGASQAYQQVREARSAGSTQNAAIGANGAVSSTGSALRTLQDTYQQGQDASNQIQLNAYNQATSTQYQGNIARASAKNISSNNFASSLLTGVSTFAGMGGFSQFGSTTGVNTGIGQQINNSMATNIAKQKRLMTANGWY